MRINQANFESLLKMINPQKNDHPGRTQNDGRGKTSNLPQKAIYLLQKLNPQLRSKVLQLFLQNNLPLEIKLLKKIINYLPGDNKQQTKQILKAINFLLRNRLPLTTQLIRSLTSNLSSEASLNKLLATGGEGKNFQPIKIDLPVDELAEKIAQQGEKLNSTLTGLINLGNKGNDELLNYLLGQKLINLQKPEMLLFLELPLLFPSFNMSRVFLKIEEEKNEEDLNQDEKMYSICFFICLEKRGNIRVDLLYHPSRIISNFSTDHKETLNLLKEKLPSFTDRMQELGYNFEEPAIQPLKKDDMLSSFKSELLPETENKASLKHINFKA